MKHIVGDAIAVAKELGYDVAHDGKSNYFNFSDGFAIGYFEAKERNIFSLMVEVKSTTYGTKYPYEMNTRFDGEKIAQQLENTLLFNPDIEEDDVTVYWRNLTEFMDEHWNRDWRLV